MPKIPVIYTHDECRRMVACCPKRYHSGRRARAIIVLMWRCGLRVSEVCDVQIQDVDFEAATIRIIGKGGKLRTVGIDDGTRFVLKAWIKIRNEKMYEGRELERGFLICSRGAARLCRHGLYKLIRRVSTRAGIYPVKACHPHAFRHTHAMELMEEGVPLNVIQQHLGHSNIQTTSIYLQGLRPEQVIGVVKKREW